jgi:hypothetical protein
MGIRQYFKFKSLADGLTMHIAGPVIKELLLA